MKPGLYRLLLFALLLNKVTDSRRSVHPQPLGPRS